MTSNLTGNGLPLPQGNCSFALPPSRTVSQNLQQIPRSWPRQSDLQSKSPTISRDTSEPPFKRQKRETIRNELERIGGGATARPVPGQTPSISREGFASSETDANRCERGSHAHEPPLLPLRPGKASWVDGLQQGRPLAFERAARRDAVPVKAYVPEPPSIAPRLHKTGPADFFPWTGGHAEDVLNELTTKQGFYDKSQVSKDETNTAKHSIHQSLKHRSGLQVLSSLFVSTLDKRQVHGTITATSTFKPPPRVTLTDTKREAWLGDLANPSIPLRRLSRTIPHGIRGKILLDHCLNKCIPTARAIWLAKCVGANEIRAFKRKGAGGVFAVGGESKWIKDWTTNVEQFLESIIGACGSLDWKENITYGLRLTSHLYSEHLLDRAQYLDWVIGSTQDSDLDSLPLWLLVVQIHQQEILSHRQRGKHLAEAMLEHFSKANSPAYKESYKPVLQQIVAFLRTIMSTAPACFLLPQCWDKHQVSLRVSLSREGETLPSCFEGLCRRNFDLRDRSSRANGLQTTSPRKKIINTLDRMSTERNYGKTAGACLRVTSDHHLLISTCIEWSASVYRQGSFRIYAAARLLRIWSKHGVELQQPILDFLSTGSAQARVRKSEVYRLLAELVSSKHLWVGKYLQWLMARGTLHGYRWPDPDGPCEVRFLLEIPLHDLPSHILNLRQSLLSPLAVPSNYEANLIAALKARLSKQIPSFFLHDVPPPARTLDIDAVALSQTVKSEVARWIRQTLVDRLQLHHSLSLDSEGSGQRPSNPGEDCPGIITLAEFQTIRKILEHYGSFSILADLINVLSTEMHGSILTTICDTINFHFHVFDAIGATADLFRNLCDRLEDLSGQEAVQSAFVESLIDLGRRLPEANREVQKLRKELCLFAPKTLAAACSPISDNMVEAAHSAEPTFADDMDQMLAGGTSMDKQTLTRVFEMIMAHLNKMLNGPEYSIARISQLLARLRGFDIKEFDLLFLDWLQEWLHSTHQPELLAVLSPMVCSKVVSLKAAFSTIAQVIRAENVRDSSFILALQALEVMTEAYSESMPTVDFRAYRVSHQLHRLIQSGSASLRLILCTVSAASMATDSPVQSLALCQVRSASVRNLLKAIFLQQPRISEEIDLPSYFRITHLDFQQCMTSLLRPDGHIRELKWEIKSGVSNILDAMDEFNTPLAQIELHTVLKQAIEPADEVKAAFSEIVIEQVIASTDLKLDLLAYLASELPIEQARLIRERAEREMLGRMSNDNTTKVNPVELHSLISIIEASTFSILDGETAPIVEQVTISLSHFIVPAPLGSDQINNVRAEDQALLVGLLVRLLMAHQSTLQHSKFSQDTLLRLLTTLSLLLNELSISSDPLLQRQVLDALTFLSDSLNDETRTRCIHTLRDQYRAKDPRLQFVFGYDEMVENERLQLVTKNPWAADLAVTSTTQPYALRRWEMMQDATPLATENDTSLSLSLFGARKSVL